MIKNKNCLIVERRICAKPHQELFRQSNFSRSVQEDVDELHVDVLNLLVSDLCSTSESESYWVSKVGSMRL